MDITHHYSDTNTDFTFSTDTARENFCKRIYNKEGLINVSKRHYCWFCN